MMEQSWIFRQVYKSNRGGKVSGTITTTGDGGIMTKKVRVIGRMDHTKDHTLESANRVYDAEGCSPTLNTCGGGGLQPKVIDKVRVRQSQYRIRKLTPRECGRLMGVKDGDIDKMLAVNSASQCYKQFGNSIVVQVLEAIFKKLNIEQKGV